MNSERFVNNHVQIRHLVKNIIRWWVLQIMWKTFKCHLDRSMRLSCVAELIPRTDKNHEFELLFSLALHLFIIADDVVQSLKILTNPLDFIFSITGQSLIHLSISPFSVQINWLPKVPKYPPRLWATFGQFRLSVGPALAHQERDDNMQMPEWYW